MTDDTKVIEKLLKKRKIKPYALKDYSAYGLEFLVQTLRDEHRAIQTIEQKLVHVKIALIDQTATPIHIDRDNIMDNTVRIITALKRNTDEYDKAISELHEYIAETKDTDEELEEIEN